MAMIFQEGFQPLWEEDLYTELDSSKSHPLLLYIVCIWVAASSTYIPVQIPI
jgi:hypothetical protein